MPPRSTKVPTNAEWAGGVDGGAWILCNRISKEPWGPVFECTTFNDYTGNEWSRGLYVVSKKRNGSFERVLRFEDNPKYSEFDGVIIYLKSTDLLMVPHGEIEYPFNGGGKRITYDHGKQTSPEIEY